MAESLRKGYRRLFQIRLLHHYWLDEGVTAFDLIASQDKREQRLISYDVRPLLAVTPTASTRELLAGLGCLYKDLASGFLVAAPDSAVIANDALFEFVVTVQDPALHNYTALTLRPQKIYELFHAPDRKVYRYKENVPLFANLTGASRGSGAAKRLYLSSEIPALAADDQVEALFVSGTALRQLTGDQPGGGSVQLAAQAGDLPPFASQADLPALVPPAGLSGVPARGVELTREIPDRVFALIRIWPRRADDDDFSLTDATGHPKAAGPVFDLRFKSRSSTWQYFDKVTGALIATESAPLPHTHHGNPGSRQKPQGLVKAVQSGGKITQLVSEVFI